MCGVNVVGNQSWSSHFAGRVSPLNSPTSYFFIYTPFLDPPCHFPPSTTEIPPDFATPGGLYLPTPDSIACFSEITTPFFFNE